MSLHHAASGEVINLRPPGEKLEDTPSVALLRSSQLEVMRLVLQAGRSIPQHHVPGELTLQCLTGKIELDAHGKKQALHAGEMVYLEGSVPYAIHAVETSALLMTIVLMHDKSELRRAT